MDGTGRETEGFDETPSMLPDAAIATFKELILSRPEVGFLRTDRDWILRFLRSRQYDPHQAFEVFTKYYSFMHQNHFFYSGYNVNNPEVRLALENGLPGVLREKDSRGRRVILMFTAQWNWEQYPLLAVHRALCLSLDCLLNDLSVQENGVVLIIDWTGFTFRQLQVSALRSIVDCLNGYPVHFKSLHCLGQSWYVEAVISLLKPFLLRKAKIYFHGHNLSGLHQRVPREILPTELGGEQGPYQSAQWIEELMVTSG